MERENNRGVVEEGGNQNNRQPQRPHPPQQQYPCPRCDSMNTKFCYYNNYSLAQPRHYCKTCKRYWTQGGTFRNIPVGGGSRKGKRGRTSSSKSSISEEVVQIQTHPNLAPLPVITPYLSSLASQSQSVRLGGDVFGSGTSQNQYLSQIRPLNSRFFYNQMGSADRGLLPSNMANTNSVSFPKRWPQSFINNNNNNNNNASANQRASVSDASLWNNAISGTASVGGYSGQNNIRGGSASLIPNNWPDLSGFGPLQ